MTLIELMVAMVVSLIMLFVIYRAHDTQVRAHVTQREVVNMSQNIRACMYYMERAIRMAGYDVSESAGAGFENAFPGGFGAIGPRILSNYLAFSVDADDSGTIDANDQELFAYRLNGDRLEQFSTGAITWNPIAENIDALNFVYIDETGNRTSTPSDVRAVQLTIVARSGDDVPIFMKRRLDTTAYTNQQGDVILAQPNDNFRRMKLAAEVNCRNMYR
jgi:type IV pilus assembly protein PilW